MTGADKSRDRWSRRARSRNCWSRQVLGATTGRGFMDALQGQGNHHRAGDPLQARRSSAAARPDEDRGEGPADGRRRARADGRDTWRRCPTTPTARRQYSFSRLTGKLHAQPAGGEASPLDADASAEPPLDARGLGTLVHAVLAEIDFARPGDVADLVRRHAEEQLPEAEGRVGRADRDDRAVSRVAACRRDRRGQGSVPRVGVPAGLAARRLRNRKRRSCRSRALSARFHRLPLPRRGRPVAAGRLQDQSRDGRHAGGDGGGVRDADAGVRPGRRADPEIARRRSWRSVFSGRGWNIISPGTPPPGSAWWSWSTTRCRNDLAHRRFLARACLQIGPFDVHNARSR